MTVRIPPGAQVPHEVRLIMRGQTLPQRGRNPSQRAEDGVPVPAIGDALTYLARQCPQRAAAGGEQAMCIDRLAGVPGPAMCARQQAAARKGMQAARTAHTCLEADRDVDHGETGAHEQYGVFRLHACQGGPRIEHRYTIEARDGRRRGVTKSESHFVSQHLRTASQCEPQTRAWRDRDHFVVDPHEPHTTGGFGGGALQSLLEIVTVERARQKIAGLCVCSTRRANSTNSPGRWLSADMCPAGTLSK